MTSNILIITLISIATMSKGAGSKAINWFVSLSLQLYKTPCFKLVCIQMLCLDPTPKKIYRDELF